MKVRSQEGYSSQYLLVLAMFENLEDLEVKPILTTKTDQVVWSIFPDFGAEKTEAPEPVEVEE